MKKLFAALAAATMLAGCGNGVIADDKSESVRSPAATEAQFVTDSGLELKEGVHFRKEPAIDRDMDSLTVLFWYGCPHCQEFRKPLWDYAAEQGVHPDERHALMTSSWGMDALFFYTAQIHHERFDELHRAYFDAREMQRDALNEGELTSLLDRNGMSLDAFVQHGNQERVRFQMERTVNIQKHYKVAGVPTLIVAGQYVMLNNGFDNNEQMLEGVNAILKAEGIHPEDGPILRDQRIDSMTEKVTLPSETD